MTRDDFAARYALLEQVAAEGARSFHAVTPTGGVAMVHFLDGGVTEANLALLSALERLEPGRRARVREVTAVEGAITVVTDRIEGFRSLPAWLHAVPSPSAEPPAPAAAADPPPSPSTEASSSGEFTRLFRAGDLAGAAAAPVPPAADAPDAPIPAPPPSSGATAPPPPPGDAVASAAAPGEFTRLFRAMDLDDALPASAHGGAADAPASPESRVEPLPDPLASPASPERARDDDSLIPPPLPPATGEGRFVMDAGVSGPAAAPVDEASRPAATDGAPPALGATGAFAAASPPARGEAELPAAGAAAGAYTRFFQRLEPPAGAADPRARPSADTFQLASSGRMGSEAEPPVDAGYLERLYTPSPEPPRAPAHEPVSAASPAPPPPPTPSPSTPFPSAPAPSFAAPNAPIAGAAPVPSPAPPPAAARAEVDSEAARPGSFLLAGLAVVAVLAILVVVFVVAG